MSLALLFPGQGTQHAAMLPWLDTQPEAGPMLRAMEAIVGRDWRSRSADADWATRNDVAQPLLAGIQLAAWTCLAARLPSPAAVLGYSVGEVAAYGVAGVLAPAAALRASVLRAAAMDRCAAVRPGSLVAITDLSAGALEDWCRRFGLSIAIRLGPDRAVVGGDRDSMASARAHAEREHVQLRDIGVRVASHTPCMEEAARGFAAELERLDFARPAAVVVCNSDAAAHHRPGELAQCLAAQLARPIDWPRCMETLAERRIRCVLELGPGSTLSASWRAAHGCIPVRSADEFRSPQAVADWVRATLRA